MGVKHSATFKTSIRRLSVYGVLGNTLLDDVAMNFYLHISPRATTKTRECYITNSIISQFLSISDDHSFQNSYGS